MITCRRNSQSTTSEHFLYYFKFIVLYSSFPTLLCQQLRRSTTFWIFPACVTTSTPRYLFAMHMPCSFSRTSPLSGSLSSICLLANYSCHLEMMKYCNSGRRYIFLIATSTYELVIPRQVNQVTLAIALAITHSCLTIMCPEHPLCHHEPTPLARHEQFLELGLQKSRFQNSVKAE